MVLCISLGASLWYDGRSGGTNVIGGIGKAYVVAVVWDLTTEAYRQTYSIIWIFEKRVALEFDCAISKSFI